MVNGPTVVPRRDEHRGRMRPQHMTRPQQHGSGDAALTVPGVAREIRLYRIVRRRYSGHEQREQACNAGKKREVGASPCRHKTPFLFAHMTPRISVILFTAACEHSMIVINRRLR